MFIPKAASQSGKTITVLPLFFYASAFRRKADQLPSFFLKPSCFCLHNALFYYKMVLEVVESGTKWLKVVDFTPLKADRGRHFMAGD